MEPAPARFSLGQWKLSPVAVLFTVAALVRLWVLSNVTGTPDALPDQGDMKFYSDWARRIAGGVLSDGQAFYGLPGYAYWLAGIYKVLGFQPYVAALIQVFVEAFTATLIFRLAPLAFGGSGEAETKHPQTAVIGWMAALGWVFFVPAQAYAAVLMPTCFLVGSFWFVVWWVLRRRAVRPAAKDFFLLGLLAGVVAMMVANILFLLPLVVAAIFLRRHWGEENTGKFTNRARALAAALMLTGTAVGVLPCALHNYVWAGEPVVLSAHAGINAFIGNNPQATGYPQIPPPLHMDQRGLMQDSVTWAERAAGHHLRRVEISAFWSGLARRWVREHPGAWLRLEAKKLGNFWNGFEYDDLGALAALREDGALLPGPGWALAATLALPGMALAARRQPRARWIIAAVALHMASVLTVFVTERYRLAAAPGLLLLGSYGVVELWREFTARRWLPVVAYAAILAGAAVLVHWPVDPGLHHLDEFHQALADLEGGRYDAAERKLQGIIDDKPVAEAYFALGNVALARGERTRAKGFYRQTLRLDPQHDRALNNLGLLALEERRWGLAEALLNGSLRIDPSDAKTAYLLAQARFEQHNVEGAHLALVEAMRLRPDEPLFLKLNDQLQAQRPAESP